MGLNEEERETVVRLELEKAQTTLTEMDVLCQSKLWNAAANRMYYALFHAVSALLIHDGHIVKSHRGILVLFGQQYVRKGIFTKEDGALLSELIIMRDNADYNCFYNVTEEKIVSFIAPSRNLIERISQRVESV